jgi:hypothetical protein
MPQPSKRGAGRRASRKERQPRAERTQPGVGETSTARAGGAGELRASESGLRSQGRVAATSRALVIGIDQYGGPPNDLTCCTVDADAIARLLRERHGFGDVRVLTDDDATVAQVEEELQWLLENPKPNDRFVLYFSGLGFTKHRDGILEECLVLQDGFLESDEIVTKAASIPPGALTVIIDASFAGGTETYIAEPSRPTPELEAVRVKTWVPVGEEGTEAETLGTEYRKVSAYRRFGCTPTTSPAAIAQTFTAARAQTWQPPAGIAAWSAAMSVGDGAGAPQLNGLVISAALESEPAAANTSKTDGLSAFTFALVQSVEALGEVASTADVLNATNYRLKTLGLRQTPRLLEPATPGDLRVRRFVTLEPVATADTLRFMSEPKFWEGVLAAAAPRLNAWAVTRKEGDLMSTSYQPMTGAYQAPFGTTAQAFGMGQQPFGTAQVSPDELQRTVPAVLAAVIPTLVPLIANAILTQQRGGQAMGGIAPWGAYQSAGYQQTPHFGLGVTGGYNEEVQRLLPVLAPVLANVIPNIVPQIVQGILTQQRQGPAQGFGTQFGTQFGGTDLWQAVSQSVNESLQRAGIQPQPTAGRF